MKISWYKASVIAIFIWVAAAGSVLAWRTSMTTDEGIHTASAYLAFTRGEHRFDPEHPFLFKYFTALPLLVVHPNLPPDDQKLWAKAAPTFYDSWSEAREWTDQWFYKSNNNAKEMIFLARIPGVLALLGLCALVLYITTRWFNPTVGLWALFFTAFNPTLLAHGSLTNTDTPLALAFLAALWALWKYYEKPGYKTAIWAGLGIAATMLTKMSGVAILPIAFIWIIYVAVRKKQSWSITVLHTLAALATLFIAIWTVYFWHSPITLDNRVLDPLQSAQSLLSEHGTSLESVARVLHWILPSAYLKGLFIVIGGSEFGRNTFLLNHLYASGVWYYFPVLFVLKTQLIGLLIFVAGLGLISKKLSPKKWSALAVLMVTTLVIFGGLAIKSKLNLGIRHITPLLPLLSVFLAASLVHILKALKVRHLIPLVIICYALPVFWQFNNLLGFSNLLVVPSNKAYLYYDDSNLDWGQHAELIAKTAEEQFSGQEIYVNYFWNPYALGYFGLESHPLDFANLPPKGIIIATATQLSRDSDYAVFRTITPVYTIANDAFFYRATDVPHK